MSIRSDITASSGWYKHEDKSLLITVTDDAGDPVDLDGVGLLWRVLRDAASPTVYLEKTDLDGIAITGADDNIATITIDASTDYADLDAGIHRHELWDQDNNLLLAYGDCWLLPASAPVATP